ncbi:MAG: hypothetical protein U0946_07375, partial [Patescibacteria group bacterium]|nr:hypothetical protein [Patescibacteria group bacterium]
MVIYSKLEPIKVILEMIKVPSYYLDEVRRFIYQKDILDFEKMTSLPKNIRQILKKQIGSTLSLTNINEVMSN